MLLLLMLLLLRFVSQLATSVAGVIPSTVATSHVAAVAPAAAVVAAAAAAVLVPTVQDLPACSCSGLSVPHVTGIFASP